MGSERSASLYLDHESDAGSDASGPTTLSTASASAAPPKTGRGPGRRESRNDLEYIDVHESDSSDVNFQRQRTLTAKG